MCVCWSELTSKVGLLEHIICHNISSYTDKLDLITGLSMSFTKTIRVKYSCS